MTGKKLRRGLDPRCVILRLQDWPYPDRIAWEMVVKPTDPFADAGGERSALRPHSNKRVECSYGRWLTFLIHAGELAGAPASRIRRDLVERYLRELRDMGNCPSTVGGRLTDLLLMAKIFDSGADWTFIKNLAQRAYAVPAPPKDKRPYLRRSDELYRLGIELIGRAKGVSWPVEAAVLHRDGLIIAFLASVPLRARNVIQLQLGLELQQFNGAWFGHLPGHTMKNHAPFDFNWPEELVGPLKEYLDIHRPLLASRNKAGPVGAGNYLWLSRGGSALNTGGLYLLVTRQTAAAFGTPLNPHSFRDAAATTIAIHDPEHVRTVGPVLGHRTQRVAESYYNQARSLDAQRRYSSALAKLRRPPGRHKP